MAIASDYQPLPAGSTIDADGNIHVPGWVQGRYEIALLSADGSTVEEVGGFDSREPGASSPGTGIASATYEAKADGAQTITVTDATWFGDVGITTSGGKSIPLSYGAGYTFATGQLTILAAAGVLKDDIITYSYASGVVGAAPAPAGYTDAQIDALLAAKADEDDRFLNLSTFDPAVPESEIFSLINWGYEIAPSGSTWTLKPGKSVLFTAGRALLFGQNVQEGHVFGVYIDPAASVNGIVLTTSQGGIDGLASKRYLPGTSLVFRYTQFPSYTDANGNQVPARMGLRTMQQTSLIAASILSLTTTRTADYTLGLADAGCLVPVASASAVTVTVPDHVSVPFPIGATLYVAQDGAGVVTIAPAAGVVVQTAAGYKVGGQWLDVALHKRDLNTWVLKGGVS